MVNPLNIKEMPKFKNLPIALKLKCGQELSGVLDQLAVSRFLPRESLIQYSWVGPRKLYSLYTNQHPQVILVQMFCRYQLEKY